MRVFLVSALATAAALIGGAAPLAAQRLGPPPGWRWVLDAPARLADQPLDPLAAPDTLWRFVSVPSGWEVTTGPGVLLFPADQPGDTGYVLEAEVVLLPNSGTDELGLVLEGAAGSGDSAYTAFLVKPDGSVAVVERRDTTTAYLMPWTPHRAVAAPGADHPLVRNLLRLRVTKSALSFAVNGVEITSLPRGNLTASGRVGFRFGHDLNVRVSSLNLTYQLLPSRR
jgi:hypothetical protein